MKLVLSFLTKPSLVENVTDLNMEMNRGPTVYFTATHTEMCYLVFLAILSHQHNAEVYGGFSRYDFLRFGHYVYAALIIPKAHQLL